MEEEPQQPTESLSQQNGHGADTTNLLDSGSESRQEDKKEKIMPKEIRHKVSSVVPALLKVIENDKVRYCGCTASCLNSFCQPCNTKSFTKEEDTTSVKCFTETLHKGSEAGRVIFQEIIFPLIRPLTRDLIAISEFLVGLTILIMSIISIFLLGNNALHNVVHCALATLSTVLGLADMIVSLKFSGSRYRGNDTEDNQTWKRNDKEPSFLKKGWDTGRILISEAILYPLLVCDLIEFIVYEGYVINKPTDIIKLTLFILSSLLLIFYVYIMRLGILLTMVVHLQECRQLNLAQKKALDEWSAENEITTEKGNKLDRYPTQPAAKKAGEFQVYFILHVMGQMVMQITMIVAISMKLVDDNENRAPESPLHISNELWLMLVGGYIMPFLGILSFFVPTFYWVYEHENGLCLDILNLLNMPGINRVLFSDGDDMTEACESIQKITSKLNDGNKLRKSFEELQNVHFCRKVSYAFRNPFLVMASLGYTFAQIAFVVLAIIAIRMETLGTIIYCILSIIVVVLANVYIILIAALWTAVIAGILVAIAIIIVLIAGICVIYMNCPHCTPQSNRNENRKLNKTVHRNYSTI